MVQRSRVLGLAGATVCCAIGIGYFLVLGPSEPAALAAQDYIPDLPVDPHQPLLLEQITLTSARAAVATAAGLADRSTPAPQCAATLKTSLLPDAMVSVVAQVPCQPHARATFHHSGMMFSQRLDANGTASVTIPALAEQGVFILEVENGQSVAATQQVSGLDEIDRVVLQWHEFGGFALHAQEFGAAYGGAGHVWRDMDQDGAGTLQQLGDPGVLVPRLAEVYSTPRRATSADAAVAVSIEVEISADNCDRDVAAQTIELRDGQLQTRDLVLNMPACSAVGDFLVLNNLVENLTIAQN